MRKLFSNKVDFIIPLIKGKSVLDLGVVDHQLSSSKKATWLHGHICKQARSAKGVDILEKEVEALNKQGYKIVSTNVETMELGETFEVAVAGDIIEHLGNPGLFLSRVSAHLIPGGIFIITTPNPLTFLRFSRLLILGWIGCNEEHTCWFTRKTMGRLAKMYGFRIVEKVYVDDIYQWYFAGPLKWIILSSPFLVVNWLLCRIRPQMSETLGFVLEKPKLPLG